MSTIKVDTVRPVTADASLTLQGDSGGSGVTGLTIDSSGNVTFAQTISGGTIGSSVVFPAGHVIKYNSTTTESIAGISTGTTGVGTGLSVGITPSSASSKIIIQADLCVGKDSNVAGIGYYIYRTAPSNTSSANTTNGTHKASAWSYLNTGSYSVINGLSVFFEDTPADNTSVHTYEVYVISNLTMTTYLNKRGEDNLWGGTSSITVFEVSQ